MVQPQTMAAFDLRAFRYWRDVDPDRYHTEVRRWVELRGWNPEAVINGPAATRPTGTW